MFRTASLYSRASLSSIQLRSRSVHTGSSPAVQEKLKILFCGADRFSVRHLDALHSESLLPDSSIGAINVVTRTDKRTGRGGKHISSPLVKSEAARLDLPIHQLDSFAGWNPPPTDLIIAVSFGLLMPARIINASKYGGINVHPSLLPDLRGAAPVHWAIMLGRKHTGVTIQSLHPTKFDEGIIIDQTPSPGIPINGKWGGLVDVLAGFGAEMLINTIRKRLFVPPYQPIPPREFDEIAMAPKIASEHRQVDFNALSADEILRRRDALANLYAFAQTATGDRVRIIMSIDLRIMTDVDAEISAICRWQPIGQPFAIHDSQEEDSLLVNTIDGKTLCIPKLTVEGGPMMPSVLAARRAKLMGPISQNHGYHKYRVSWFHSPLTTSDGKPEG